MYYNAKFQFVLGKAKQCRVVLAPSLSEAVPDYQASSGHRSMSLGHLVLLVQHVMTYLNSTRTSLRDLQDKLSSLNHLSSNELSQFVSSERVVSSVDQRSLVAEQIQKNILENQHQLELSIDTVENSLFVLWRHLDYFFHSTTQRQRIGKLTILSILYVLSIASISSIASIFDYYVH